MHSSDDASAVPAPAKTGMSKVLLVSLIINAVLVVVIAIAFLIVQNKIDKIKTDAETTVNNARVELVVLQRIAAFKQNLGDTVSLANISVESYPYKFCQKKFVVGTAKEADVKKLLESDTEPTPTATYKGENEVEYKFDYIFRSVTIIIKYEGADKVVKSIEYRAEQ